MTERLESEDPIHATRVCECIWLNPVDAVRGNNTPGHVRIGLRWRGRTAQISLDGLQGLDGRLHPGGLSLLPEGLRRLLLSEAIDRWRSALPDPLREVECVLLPEDSKGMSKVGVEWFFQLRYRGVPQWSGGALQLGDASPLSQLAWARLIVSAGGLTPPLSAAVHGEIVIGGVELLPQELEQLEPGDWVSLRNCSQGRDGVRAEFLPADVTWATQPVLLRRDELMLDETRLLRLAASGLNAPSAGQTAALVHAKVLSDPMGLPLAWLCNPHQPLHLPARRQHMRWWLVHEKLRRAELTWQAIGRQPGFRIAAVSR